LSVFEPNQPALAKGVQDEVSIPVGAPHLALIKQDKVTERSASVEMLLAILRSILKFMIVGGLILWAFPRQFQSWVEQVQKRPLASAGYGAVVLINGYLLPVLMVVAIVGLLLGLIYLTLPTLAWTFFWVAMGLSVAAFSLFLAVSAFFTKVIVAFLVGTIILSRVASGALQYRIVPLLLGLVIYVLLASIPYVGFIIGLVVTLLGLGAIWLSRKQVFCSQGAEVVPCSEPAAV
jgi:hypothetical protein